MKTKRATSGSLTQFRSEEYNIVRHVHRLVGKHPLYKILPVVVRIEEDPSCGEVTRAAGGQDCYAFTMQGLMKLAAAAGVSLDVRNSGIRQCDDDRSHLEVLSAMSVQLVDGRWISIPAIEHICLEHHCPGGDCAQAAAISAAETRGFYRAMQAFWDIKNVYTHADLQKPFVLPRVCLDTRLLLKHPDYRREFLHSRAYEILSSPLTKEALEGLDEYFAQRQAELRAPTDTDQSSVEEEGP